MDKEAIKILMDTYWESSGWKDNYTIEKEKFEYAKSRGIMFDTVKYSHDKTILELVKIIREINVNRISKMFLASLSSRNLYLRSALGSYAVNKNIREHNHIGKIFCDYCGAIKKEENMDLNIFNFERLKWGGVRHDSLEYAYFDLKTTLDVNVEPKEEDKEIFRQMIIRISELPKESRIRDVEIAIKEIVKSNKQEREIILQILGYCGIIQPIDKKSYFDVFVEIKDRDEPQVNKIDWSYPVSWWRGKDSINSNAIEYYFKDII